MRTKDDVLKSLNIEATPLIKAAMQIYAECYWQKMKQANDVNTNNDKCHIQRVSFNKVEVCEHYFEPTVQKGKIYKRCLKCGIKIEQT